MRVITSKVSGVPDWSWAEIYISSLSLSSGGCEATAPASAASLVNALMASAASLILVLRGERSEPRETSYLLLVIFSRFPPFISFKLVCPPFSWAGKGISIEDSIVLDILLARH